MEQKLPKNQQEIRNYGEEINKRIKVKTIEERDNESWREVFKELNIPCYIG